MVAVTPDGKHATSESDDNTLKVWDIENGKKLLTLEGHTNLIAAAAVTSDGRYVVSASHDNTLNVWDIENGQIIDSFSGNGSFYTCTISSDGVTIIAGEGSGMVHFLRLEGVE